MQGLSRKGWPLLLFRSGADPGNGHLISEYAVVMTTMTRKRFATSRSTLVRSPPGTWPRFLMKMPVAVRLFEPAGQPRRVDRFLRII